MSKTRTLVTALLLALPVGMAHPAHAVAGIADEVAAQVSMGGVSACATVGAPRVIATELAGVPARIRVPATISVPPVVLWHGFGPPDSEDALMAMLPLDDVPAVKVYLGLPMFGVRAPTDPGTLVRRQAEDLATGVFEPVVMAAGHELPGVVDALKREGCLEDGQGIAMFGFSAGGAAVLYALAEREVPVNSAVVLNASTGLSASVAAYERATGRRYEWTSAARALARRSDAVVRAAEIAGGLRPPALLIIQGAEDALMGRIAHDLHDALVPHYSEGGQERLKLVVVEGLPHLVQVSVDIERVRALVSEWFLRP